MMQQLRLRYVVFRGAAEVDNYDEDSHTVELACDDSYAGLPDKIVSFFRFALRHPSLADIQYFVKLDEDMIVLGEIPPPLLSDYSGVHLIATTGIINTRYHIGRTPGSKWNNVPYAGSVTPYFNGGRGYSLSRFAAAIVAQGVHDDIYEDLMVAKFLLPCNIRPKLCRYFENYYISPERLALKAGSVKSA